MELEKSQCCIAYLMLSAVVGPIKCPTRDTYLRLPFQLRQQTTQQDSNVLLTVSNAGSLGRVIILAGIHLQEHFGL
jgi:hypothetical protein